MEGMTEFFIGALVGFALFTTFGIAVAHNTDASLLTMKKEQISVLCEEGKNKILLSREDLENAESLFDEVEIFCDNR